MTPTSSLDTPKNHLNEPPEKKVTFTTPLEYDTKIYNQVIYFSWYIKEWRVELGIHFTAKLL